MHCLHAAVRLRPISIGSLYHGPVEPAQPKRVVRFRREQRPKSTKIKYSISSGQYVQRDRSTRQGVTNETPKKTMPDPAVRQQIQLIVDPQVKICR